MKMPDLPNRAQLFEIGANDLITRSEARPVGRRISADQVYVPGSDINLIIGASSAMAEEIMRQTSKGLNDLTLDGAEGIALDRYIADRYSPYLARLTATPAYVSLTFTRTSTVLGAVSQAAGSIVQTQGGIRFETLEAAAFGAVSIGPVSVTGRAVNAGLIGEVAAGTITSFVSAKADPTMLVTNPENASGGDDKESDERFRARARLFYLNARRGTLGAIENGALSVSGIRQAYAEEQVSQPLGVANGFIFLYIADANGQSNSIINEKVRIKMKDYACGGIIPTVYGATIVYQEIQLDLSYNAGIDTVAAFSNVRASVVAAVNALGPGKTLELSVISKAAKSVTGVIVYDDSIVAPTGDIVPVGSQIIRTKEGMVLPV
jgi:uncharacterized phage protein gp47/JayE